MQNSDLPILIAEDCEEDFNILQLLFRQNEILNRIIRCTRGDEVIPVLEEMALKEILPGLILLDLNLIGMDGREVLKGLKGKLPFKKIPVVILSTSSSPRDIDSCYSEGANSYSIKPVGLDRLETFVTLIKNYWLESTILPQPLLSESARAIYG